MSQQQRKPAPQAFDGHVKFTRTLTTYTPKGDEVRVDYRRVHRRDGYDIEARIVSTGRKKGVEE